MKIEGLEIKKDIQEIKIELSELILKIYPIGSIYMSTKNTNPSTLFGGTWVSWGNGKVPVGVDSSDSSFNSVEKTGGEKTHTLTIAEMPTHAHDLWTKVNAQPGDGFLMRGTGGNDERKWGGSGQEMGALNTGRNEPHNNLQPYITCYMWKRTA